MLRLAGDGGILCRNAHSLFRHVSVLYCLTCSGEVPNMYPADEKAEICEKMRQLDRQRDKAKQTDGSPMALYNMFVQRCRDQLHVVLAMSPIGDAFRNRLRKFPSLVNCCTIDWFQSWPADALQVTDSPPLPLPPPVPQCARSPNITQQYSTYLYSAF